MKYNGINYNYIHFLGDDLMHPLAFYERKQHGTKEFPAEYYYVDARHPRYVMSAHWHTEWELIRIQSGVFTLWADDQEIRATAGDVLLIRDSMLHRGIPENCVYECFVFDLHGLFRTAELLKKQLRPFYRLELLPRIYFPAKEKDGVCLFAEKLMKNCRAEEPVSALATIGCLCLLFENILRSERYTPSLRDPLPRTHRIDRIKATLKYIEEHYGEPITLQTLADIAGMNTGYFCRVFQAVTRSTPIDYLIDYRIEQAAMMLRTTELSVTEIAMSCGFNDHSYFTRIFKRIKKQTPRAYRNEQPRILK